MTTYIVTFDIKDKSRLNKIKNHLREEKSGICPIHENAYAIRDTKSASEIVDELAAFMTNGDRVFVIRTGTAAAWRNSYGEENTNWLKKYL